MAKPALGRGLGALLGVGAPGQKPGGPSPASAPAGSPEAAADPRERVSRVPLKSIRPCPFQPRKDFPEESLNELANSIREQGVVQPLIVRARGEEFELIAGERRWRAAQLLGLTEIPVLVREADDQSVLELALIENLQRENLNPIEEAHGFSQLIEQFGLTQEGAAAKVGKSRAAVANALRLLKLAPEIQEYVRSGHLSVGHAKVILGLENPESQKAAAERVLKETLNVRQTEDLVAQWPKEAPAVPAPAAPAQAGSHPSRDVHITDLENRLKERLGTKVALRYRHGKGSMEIRFYNDADLERLLDLLGIKMD
jgi:ParB family chromosome partitioning protein